MEEIRKIDESVSSMIDDAYKSGIVQGTCNLLDAIRQIVDGKNTTNVGKLHDLSDFLSETEAFFKDDAKVGDLLWHDFKKEKPAESGMYIVHEFLGNRHSFVILAEYDIERDEWRPWDDIEVVGLPLNETQLSMITHWKPLYLPYSIVHKNG